MASFHKITHTQTHACTDTSELILYMCKENTETQHLHRELTFSSYEILEQLDLTSSFPETYMMVKEGSQYFLMRRIRGHRLWGKLFQLLVKLFVVQQEV